MYIYERLTTFTRKSCVFQNWNYFFFIRSIRLSTVVVEKVVPFQFKGACWLSSFQLLSVPFIANRLLISALFLDITHRNCCAFSHPTHLDHSVLLTMQSVYWNPYVVYTVHTYTHTCTYVHVCTMTYIAIDVLLFCFILRRERVFMSETSKHRNLYKELYHSVTSRFHFFGILCWVPCSL